MARQIGEHPDDKVSGAAPPEGGARLPAPLRALRHRNFRLFASGQLISLTGTWLQSIAQSWLVYRMTGSSVLLGLVSFCGQIPVFVFAPLGGAIADRGRRRDLLVATQSASMLLALLLGTLTLTGTLKVAHIFVIAAMLGLVNAFDVPIRQAFVIEMVGGRADLANAIALNSSIVNGARMLGPTVAGVLVAAVGEGWCFVLNGASYVAVLVGLLAMRVPARRATGPHPPAMRAILEGFQYVGRTGPIRALLLLVGLVSLLGMPYTVLMPIFADRILHGGPRGLGILMGSAGIGALGAGVTLAARSSPRGLGRWLSWSAAGFGAALVAFSLSRWFVLSAAVLVAVGFCMVLVMAASNTLLQTLAPDALRGRVMSAYSMMFFGMAPVGALLAGTLASRIGAPGTVAIGGGLSFAGALVFAAHLPKFRAEAQRMAMAGRGGGVSAPESRPP